MILIPFFCLLSISSPSLEVVEGVKVQQHASSSGGSSRSLEDASGGMSLTANGNGVGRSNEYLPLFVKFEYMQLFGINNQGAAECRGDNTDIRSYGGLYEDAYAWIVENSKYTNSKGEVMCPELDCDAHEPNCTKTEHHRHPCREIEFTDMANQRESGPKICADICNAANANGQDNCRAFSVHFEEIRFDNGAVNMGNADGKASGAGDRGVGRCNFYKHVMCQDTALNDLDGGTWTHAGGTSTYSANNAKCSYTPDGIQPDGTVIDRMSNGVFDDTYILKGKGMQEWNAHPSPRVEGGSCAQGSTWWNAGCGVVGCPTDMAAVNAAREARGRELMAAFQAFGSKTKIGRNDDVDARKNFIVSQAKKDASRARFQKYLVSKKEKMGELGNHNEAIKCFMANMARDRMYSPSQSDMTTMPWNGFGGWIERACGFGRELSASNKAINSETQLRPRIDSESMSGIESAIESASTINQWDGTPRATPGKCDIWGPEDLGMDFEFYTAILHDAYRYQAEAMTLYNGDEDPSIIPLTIMASSKSALSGVQLLQNVRICLPKRDGCKRVDFAPLVPAVATGDLTTGYDSETGAQLWKKANWKEFSHSKNLESLVSTRDEGAVESLVSTLTQGALPEYQCTLNRATGLPTELCKRKIYENSEADCGYTGGGPPMRNSDKANGGTCNYLRKKYKHSCQAKGGANTGDCKWEPSMGCASTSSIEDLKELICNHAESMEYWAYMRNLHLAFVAYADSMGLKNNGRGYLLGDCEVAGDHYSRWSNAVYDLVGKSEKELGGVPLFGPALVTLARILVFTTYTFQSKETPPLSALFEDLPNFAFKESDSHNDSSQTEFEIETPSSSMDSVASHTTRAMDAYELGHLKMGIPQSQSMDAEY